GGDRRSHRRRRPGDPGTGAGRRHDQTVGLVPAIVVRDGARRDPEIGGELTDRRQPLAPAQPTGGDQPSDLVVDLPRGAAVLGRESDDHDGTAVLVARAEDGARTAVSTVSTHSARPRTPAAWARTLNIPVRAAKGVPVENQTSPSEAEPVIRDVFASECRTASRSSSSAPSATRTAFVLRSRR